jgi:urease accessory protein
MLTISERATTGEPEDRLVLPFDLRRRSRLRVRLESGADAALLLERGGALQDGDLLRADDGRLVQVVAADEPVMTVTADHPLNLMRAAYHLGNRHVPVQVGPGWLRLIEDHVLEHMLEGLGVAVVHELLPFEPEHGAYGGGGHHHHHDDDEDEEGR